MNIQFNGDPNEVRVHKKRDGLMVMRGPYILDFMHWHEGIIWRLTKRLPRRLVKGDRA